MSGAKVDVAGTIHRTGPDISFLGVIHKVEGWSESNGAIFVYRNSASVALEDIVLLRDFPEDWPARQTRSCEHGGNQPGEDCCKNRTSEHRDYFLSQTRSKPKLELGVQRQADALTVLIVMSLFLKHTGTPGLEL